MIEPSIDVAFVVNTPLKEYLRVSSALITEHGSGKNEIPFGLQRWHQNCMTTGESVSPLQRNESLGKEGS